MRKLFIVSFLLSAFVCLAQNSSEWETLSQIPKTEMVQIISKKTTVKGKDNKGAFIKGRSVTLEPFKMSKYLVTQQLYRAVLSSENDIFTDNPSLFDDEADDNENQDLRPVDHICWYDAVFFCNKLSELEKLTPVYNIEILSTKGNHITDANVSLKPDWHTLDGYRLPTEAEWEFSARGGDVKSAQWLYPYSGSQTPEEVMWFFSNSGEKTHEVGLKAPNGLGLYDMCGNVKEWCYDAFDHIIEGKFVNPIGAQTSPCYVLRGGSWSDNAQYCTVLRRENDKPFKLNKYYGFRIVQSGK